METEAKPAPAQRLVIVTGPSGAGRATAVRALEDIGYETIDNLPLSLLPPLLEIAPRERPLALGVDVRNRDFSVDHLIEALDRMAGEAGVSLELLFLDCHPDVLIRRFSETRRPHPLARDAAPGVGVDREIELLRPIRARANVLIDTSDLTPHDLRAEIERWFGADGQNRMALSVHSFSYKRGIPRGVDMVFDVRFLANPHWEPALRALDGRDQAVADYVTADPRFDEFYERVRDMVRFLLPAYEDEGKSHLAIAFGCTGGQHRSVAIAEALAISLEADGWRVSKRHREIERNAIAAGQGATARDGSRT
jgi:UPF0042 nucleotide-binding protein